MVVKVENKQLRLALEMVLHTLSENEEAVMRLRCGFYGGKPLTLAEVAERLDLTRERIIYSDSRLSFYAVGSKSNPKAERGAGRGEWRPKRRGVRP